MEFTKFKELIENCGILEDETAVRSYSGRGMYGDQCLAITVSRDVKMSKVIMSIVAYAIREVTECGNYDNEITLQELIDDEVEELEAALSNTCQDSMGLDQVIYFPDVKWQETKEEGEQG